MAETNADTAKAQSQEPNGDSILSAELKENPHQPDLWKGMISRVEATGDMKQISAAYRELLKQYPNSSSVQISFINNFLNHGEMFTQAEDLFKTFLKPSPWVDLWRYYLTYVRRINVGTAMRQNVQASFDFVLAQVGHDKDSGDIWADYIQFLKDAEAKTTWETQQNMDALRKVYHRAVTIPIENVAKLWEELEAFENGLNRTLAKKFLSELSPSHMQARQVLRELKAHHQRLQLPPAISTTPGQPTQLYLPYPRAYAEGERGLLNCWKAYLKWEEGNPLQFEEKDKNALFVRLQAVYRKAIVRMRYYPEIWFMASQWLTSLGKVDDAILMLRNGIEATPTSPVLNFALAEALERKKEFAPVHELYKTFIAALRVELVELQEASEASAATAANETVDTIQSQSQAPSQGSQESTDSKDGEKLSPQQEEFIAKKRIFGSIYIIYQRFARRAEGRKAARDVFTLARKDDLTPWEVYEASAMMEYHCWNEKDVPGKIFELGLKRHSGESEYIAKYLQFLIIVKDEINARALFERFVSTFTPGKARKLWEIWGRHEYQYGDLQAAETLAKRIADIYPKDSPIKRFAQQHTYSGIDAIADRDVGLGMKTKEVKQEPVAAPNGGRYPVRDMPPPATKRAGSPGLKQRDDADYRGKRPRGMSPAGRDQSRDRWGDSRRKNSPASWERDNRRREDEKPPPQVVHHFVGALPPQQGYVGPLVKPDDMLALIRGVVIPASNSRPRSPAPPPPRGGIGRPPPDYGPYQGPGGANRRRY